MNKRMSISVLNTVLVLMLTYTVSAFASTEKSVGVLVAADSSPVHKISILEIRRLYLGLPSSDGLIKETVINLADPVAYKNFLKNVMHMTDNGYRRKIVKRIFRQGGRKVNEIQNIAEIVSYLEEHPYAVSFMAEETARKTKTIKVVQVLW